jgi:hypothetical protein
MWGEALFSVQGNQLLLLIIILAAAGFFIGILWGEIDYRISNKRKNINGEETK